MANSKKKAGKPNDGKRLALHAHEVFETGDEDENMSFEDILDASLAEGTDDEVATGHGEEVYVSLDSAELRLPEDPVKAAEIEKGCETTDIMIILAQADLEYSEDVAEKIFNELKRNGRRMTKDNVIAVYRELNIS